MVRAHIDVRGIVQGVGFRPFIHRETGKRSLFGWIRNTSQGAEIEVEGRRESIEALAASLRENAPSLAFIESVVAEYLPDIKNYDKFEIIESKALDERKTLVSPDVCTCDDCLKELFDPNDRRYRYPFINCTNCGPRFTIIKDVPYDRKKTTMADFPMCDTCVGEYSDINDRRYHAQPDCCPDCGPELYFLDAEGERVEGDPVETAQKYLSEGKIVAIKGLGGFHLACRTDSPELIAELRRRKHRDEKPFAIMCADIEETKSFCTVTPAVEKLLTAHQRPIVLMEKREKASFEHISENGYVGVMLPYAPVHFLLLSGEIKSLVMTSANLSDRPIMYKNEEVLEHLRGIADGFLMNNRDIHVRCDDSLMWVYEGREYFARRSRGYVPFPITAGVSKKILACGAEQKATFSLSKNGYLFPSQHIGDLKNLETLENYESQIAHFENLFDIKPEILVCDLHPDYMSTNYAEERAKREKLPLVKVQHHHAHMASCMADNSLEEDCIGVIWDGTGHGTDGRAWGGEFLTGGYKGFERKGTIRPISLPGGDKAAKEIWRIACALKKDAEIEDTSDRMKMVDTILSLGLNSPETTSIGRLFDGVSAILGIKDSVSYEGQGAILLEASAGETDEIYSYEITQESGLYVFDYRPMIKEIAKGEDEKAVAAAKFMNTLVAMAAAMCEKIREDTGLERVVLSGGTFQNMYMLKRLTEKLRASGFEVYTHRRVATNDEGISLGQTMIAEKGGGTYVPCSTPENS